jgi:tRNA threonylcarbamoyladenosine biosynthesis protein TsaB
MNKSYLSVDTSGSYCSVALRSVGGEIVEAVSRGENDAFEQLSSLMGRVLVEAGQTVQQIDHVRVGLGPGSFTGLRIGLSFCKGLCWSLQRPLVGYCSFEAVAALGGQLYQLPSLVVASDARREELFCAEYHRDCETGVVRCIQVPHIVPLGTFIERYLDGAGSADRVILTPMRDVVVDGKKLESVASAARGGLLVSSQEQPFSVADVASVQPNYLRAVAAKTIEERKMGA